MKTPSDSFLTTGKFLRELRNRKGLSIHCVGERSGINISTISRIEQGIINPAAETIVRLVRVLDITGPDLYLLVTGHTAPESDITVKAVAPTEAELIEFERIYHQQRELVQSFLAKSLAQIHQEVCVVSGSVAGPLKPNEIARLLTLVDTPYRAAGLLYPFSLSPESLLQIHRSNGAIVRADIVAFLNNTIYADKSINFEGHHWYAWPHNIFIGLTGFYTAGRILMDNVRRLDCDFGDNQGTLSFMYYKAIALEMALSPGGPAKQIIGMDAFLNPPLWDLPSLKAGSLLLRMSRWFTLLQPEDNGWIEEVRELIQTYGTVRGK